MPAKASFCGKCGTALAAPTQGAAAAIPAVPAPAAPTVPKPSGASSSPANSPAESRAEIESPSGSLRPMVLIPAGDFLMGSPDGAGPDNEHPQHKVTLGAYYIDRHAVSNADYERFDPTHKRHRPKEADAD